MYSHGSVNRSFLLVYIIIMNRSPMHSVGYIICTFLLYSSSFFSIFFIIIVHLFKKKKNYVFVYAISLLMSAISSTLKFE